MGFFEDGKEHLGSTNAWKFLDKPNNYQLFKQESAPWSCTRA
jgi:hypothetical protein